MKDYPWVLTPETIRMLFTSETALKAQKYPKQAKAAEWTPEWWVFWDLQEQENLPKNLYKGGERLQRWHVLESIPLEWRSVVVDIWEENHHSEIDFLKKKLMKESPDFPSIPTWKLHHLVRFDEKLKQRTEALLQWKNGELLSSLGYKNRVHYLHDIGRSFPLTEQEWVGIYRLFRWSWYFAWISIENEGEQWVWDLVQRTKQPYTVRYGNNNLNSPIPCINYVQGTWRINMMSHQAEIYVLHHFMEDEINVYRYGAGVSGTFMGTKTDGGRARIEQGILKGEWV